MRELVLLFLGQFILSAGIAQKTAFFETTVFVEDAVGNRDSVVIGHDPDSNGEFNPQFGEYDIPDPLDSVFEVRAAHWNSFNGHYQDIVLSKKVIGNVEGYYPQWNCYLYPESAVLFIHAKYQPVTISWHRDIYDESPCRTGSMITSHYLHYVSPYWMEEDTALTLMRCMAEDSVYTQYLFDYGSFGFWKYEEIEGQGLDTVFAIMITLFHGGNPLSPCTGTVSSERLVENTQLMHPAYPNPVNNTLFFDTDQPQKYIINDLEGRDWLRGYGTSVNISQLPVGIYLLMTEDASGIREVQKVVKS